MQSKACLASEPSVFNMPTVARQFYAAHRLSPCSAVAIRDPAIQ